MIDAGLKAKPSMVCDCPGSTDVLHVPAPSAWGVFWWFLSGFGWFFGGFLVFFGGFSCFLVVFKYKKTSKKHPLQGLGRVI